MIELVSNFLGAVKEIFGFGRVRLAAKQSAPMQANAAARTDAAQAAEATRTVAAATDSTDTAALERLRRAAAE